MTAMHPFLKVRRTVLRRVIGALAAISCVPLAYAQSAGNAPVTLRIAYLKGTSDLTLAKAKGSLDKALAAQGVNVVWAGPFPAAAPAFEALNADAVDLTSGSSTSFVTAISGGVPMSIFAYQPMTSRNESIVVRDNSPIRALSDLAGKRVAVNRGGTGEYLLVRALTRNGIPVDRVERRYLSPSDTGSAFIGGGVDAWAIWDPFLTIALKTYDGRVLANGAQIGSENAVGYFVRQDYLRAHPAVIQTVFSVLRNENVWTAKHADEAGRIWAKELNLPEGLAPTLGANNISPLRTVQPDDVKRITNIAQWYADNKIIPKIPDVTSHIAQLTQ
jgi:sulfonate transport system substrate-binding protein